MLSPKIQLIIVIIILAAVIGWILWRLLRKKDDAFSGNCAGCALAERCSKSPAEKKARIQDKDCGKK